MKSLPLKLVFFLIFLPLQAQPMANHEVLNKLWKTALQVDTSLMQAVSEKELGIKILLPVQPIIPPSPALMDSGVGLTSWIFSKQQLEPLNIKLTAIRYERMHYYADNTMHYRLGIGIDSQQICISSVEVKDFLRTKKHKEDQLKFGGLMNLKDTAHNDEQEKIKRGNGIYSVGIKQSRLDNKLLVIWYSFNYYQCLQGVTVLQD
jgi:hypothetical protein